MTLYRRVIDEDNHSDTDSGATVSLRACTMITSGSCPGHAGSENDTEEHAYTNWTELQRRNVRPVRRIIAIDI